MKCFYPQVTEKHIYPCGQCLPCRINSRNQKAGRILLETTQWKFSYFVTLTYANDTLRFNEDENMVLHKEDVQKFLKRLRINTGVKLKYFYVGEYGDKFGRPHYHMALFINIEPNQAIREVQKAWSIRGQSEIESLNISPVRRLIGRIDLRPMVENRAQYVAQYTTKKIISDKQLPPGVPAEFAFSSKHPPIGHGALIVMADRLIRLLKSIRPECHGYDDITKYEVLKNMSQGCFRLNGRLWPLDRYSRDLMVKRITSEAGFDIAKNSWMNYILSQWKAASTFDIAQESKDRHLALVQTERWKEKRRRQCRQSNL